MQILVVFSGFLISNPLQANSQTLRTVNLQLAWHHQFQFAGYYAAKHLGYYEKKGLNVIFKEGSAQTDSAKEVLSLRAEYGVGREDILVKKIQGAPLVVLAVIMQHSPSVLIARKDSGISTPKDMIGKKVMLLPGKNNIIYESLFKQTQIPIKSFQKLVNSDQDTIKDLIEGKVDVIHAYLTNEPYVLKLQGIEYTVINPLDYGIDFYGDNLFTHKNEIENYPSDVKNFKEASLKGWEYALDNPEEIADLIIKEYAPQAEKKKLLREAEVIRELSMKSIVQIGHSTSFRWKDMADQMVDLGLIPENYKINDFLYENKTPSLWKKVSSLIGVMILLTILCLTLAIRLFYIHNANKKLSIVNQKLNQQQKNLRQELKENERNADRILSSLNYKLVIPLETIQKQIEVLSEFPLETEQEDGITQIQKQTEALRRMLDDLMLLASIMKEEFRLNFKQIQLRSFFDSLIEDYESHTKVRDLHIGLHLELHPELPEILNVDSIRLGQILKHLLENAFTHTQMGSVTIVVEQKNEHTLLFQVKDTGQGLSSVQREEIFNVSSPTYGNAKTTEGLGVGLFVCKKLVEKMGGEISCTSEIEKGSCFSFTLPIKNDREKESKDWAK